jgi:ubiquinone/menaquinone biosynthesis C-methylase UbiE
MAEIPAYGVDNRQPRDYFDQHAHRWDSMAMPGMAGRLKAIFTRLEINPAGRVLDIGSGTGVILSCLLPRLDGEGRVVEMDIAGVMLQKGAEKSGDGRVSFIQADVHRLPFAAGIFDLVICHNAFPHFSNQALALKEIAGVTARGGRVIISHIMSRDAVNSFHQHIGGVVGHDQLPDEPALRQMMGDAGFSWLSVEDMEERYIAVAWKTA